MAYAIFRPSVWHHLLISSATALSVSCSDRITGSLFKRPYPHQRYEQQLRSAGMEHSVLYHHWIRAARQSLQQPVEIDIPYQEQAYMAPDKPEATALLFDARNGERLLAELETQSADSARVFLDLFELTADTGNRFRHVQSADTGVISLSYDIPRDGKYVLRIQPELLAAVSYQLRITAGPSLANPVAAGAKQHIGSLFGVARDGGARRHEGIDIFAARLTPVIASADGVVSRVGTNNLGGKVVWLRPEGRPLHLYYAHLDSQLVLSMSKPHKNMYLSSVNIT
jgi:murein DD-endopeptidase MepM/ murein hydrolase activator NlpD